MTMMVVIRWELKSSTDIEKMLLHGLKPGSAVKNKIERRKSRIAIENKNSSC